MRRRRCDSPWNRLTDEQQKQMDAWYFVEGLGGREILKRARDTFKIDASRQTLTAYFRHREKKRVLAEGGRLTEDAVTELLMQRTGAGMSLEKLEANTVYSTALAAYEMSLAEPGSLRVKELQSLMKTLNEHRRLAMEQRERGERLTMEHMVVALKVSRDQSKMMTKEEFEEMAMETGRIMRRAGMLKTNKHAEDEDAGQGSSSPKQEQAEATRTAQSAPDASL